MILYSEKTAADIVRDNVRWHLRNPEMIISRAEQLLDMPDEPKTSQNQSTIDFKRC